MVIPEVRTELLKLAAECPDLFIRERLKFLEAQLYRRPAVRKAPRHNRRMTEDLEAAIREFAQAHPRLSQQQIGERFRVSAGRVSEATRGKRQ